MAQRIFDVTAVTRLPASLVTSSLSPCRCYTPQQGTRWRLMAWYIPGGSSCHGDQLRFCLDETLPANEDQEAIIVAYIYA